MFNLVQPQCQCCQAHQLGALGELGGLNALFSVLMMLAAQAQKVASGDALASGQNPVFGAGQTGAGGIGLGNFLGTGSTQTGPTLARPRGEVGPKTGQLVDLGGGKRVDSSIAGNVQAMIRAAKQDGVDLQIRSAHRSRREQEVLYQKYLNGTGNLAAKPGSSNHESGLAIDFGNTPGAYAWLKKNAGRFGLKNLPSEPWHYSTNGR